MAAGKLGTCVVYIIPASCREDTLEKHARIVQRVGMSYHGRTMAQKRSGRTVKVSVSLYADDVATLKRHARETYGGNLSAAFAEAARVIRQREARELLIGALGGPVLTADSAIAIDVEQGTGPRRKPMRAKRKRAA